MIDDGRERSYGEIVNTWVQTIGIIMAAIWALLYTFVYKEVWLPQSVPVNVSINLTLQKAGVAVPSSGQQRGLAAIALHIAANNPSSQVTQLFPSVFIVYGYKISRYDHSIEQDIALFDEKSKYKMKHIDLSDHTIVAWGYIMGNMELNENNELKPGETVARTFIFYVPVDKYDAIEAHVLIPNGKDLKDFKLEWGPHKERGLLNTISRKDAAGRYEAIPRDDTDGYPDLGPKYGLQTAHSMSMLSLW
jgi:hypothetical protein